MQHDWSMSSKKRPRVLQTREKFSDYINTCGLDQFQVLSEAKAQPDFAHRLLQHTHSHTHMMRGPIGPFEDMTLKYSLSGMHWILNKYMLNKINEGGHLIILGRLHDQIGKKKSMGNRQILPPPRAICVGFGKCLDLSECQFSSSVKCKWSYLTPRVAVLITWDILYKIPRYLIGTWETVIFPTVWNILAQVEDPQAHSKACLECNRPGRGTPSFRPAFLVSLRALTALLIPYWITELWVTALQLWDQDQASSILYP